MRFVAKIGREKSKYCNESKKTGGEVIILRHELVF